MEVAAEVARRLSTVRGVAAVVLGGSRARGDADAQSDVDLGIYYHPVLQTLFALNRRYFLHEKRALEIAAGFALAPAGFATTVAEMLASPGMTAAELVLRVERMKTLVDATAALSASLPS